MLTVGERESGSWPIGHLAIWPFTRIAHLAIYDLVIWAFARTDQPNDQLANSGK
jgi:hypothetical protein